MTRRITVPFVLSFVLGTAAFAQSPPATQAERFAAKVAEYEAEDRAHPPPKGAILFAGDSQFYR